MVKKGVTPLKMKMKQRELIAHWYRNLLRHHGIDPDMLDQKKGSNWFW